jgi:hypothetical protein
MDEQTTESEERKEKDAAEAAERIKRGQHWLDWMYIAEGLEVGRMKAMRRAGTNRPIGWGYNKAFGDWLNERPWARAISTSPPEIICSGVSTTATTSSRGARRWRKTSAPASIIRPRSSADTR